MKEFGMRLLALCYMMCSMFILMLACVYPFALSFDDGPQLWTCWILYPITLAIMASQKQALKWADKYM